MQCDFKKKFAFLCLNVFDINLFHGKLTFNSLCVYGLCFKYKYLFKCF